MTDTRSICLLIHGARGRMGARISALAATDRRFCVVGEHDVDDRERDEAHPSGSVDVIIDFSSDSGAQHALALAQRLSCALLIGTTGLSPATQAAVDAASRMVAVMVAANTSRGVAVVNHLIAQAARLLGPAYGIDLVESHHSGKKDAPSGTALRMVKALKDHASVDVPADRIQSIRAGDIIGEHMMSFTGPGERVQIAHIATSRDVFALGALQAAAWLAGKPAGRYTIEQSLGLNDTPQH
jgi:4-hydroxy-tetrahydrodipicolinate reductase